MSEATLDMDNTEKKLHKIWEKVFDGKVEVTDNFFDLGGHSMHALDIFVEIEEAFNKTISINKIYEHPTIQTFAKFLQDPENFQVTHVANPINTQSNLSTKDYNKLVIVANQAKIKPIKSDSLIVGLNVEGPSRPIFWCGNNYDKMLSLGEFFNKNQPFYVLYTGFKAIDLTEASGNMDKIAAHYVQEILSIQPTGPYFLGGFCLGAEVMMKIAFHLINMGHAVEYLILAQFFDKKLFHYPNNMTLVFARDSHINHLDMFNWNQPGWEQEFKISPKIDFVSGPHLIFDAKESVASMFEIITKTLPL